MGLLSHVLSENLKTFYKQKTPKYRKKYKVNHLSWQTNVYGLREEGWSNTSIPHTSNEYYLGVLFSRIL